MSESLKYELGCDARILFRAGLRGDNAGHRSIAIGNDRMLVNRFGPSFATLTPSDILTVLYDGTVIEHHPDVSPYVNETIALHGIIHRENPHAKAVAHTHAPATVTWSCFREVPEIYDQESCLLAGEVGIVEEDYEGIAATEDRVLPLARKLGKYRAAILPNHGAVTIAPNIQLATVTMLLLEGMVARNLSVYAAARATWKTPQAIKMEHALTAKREIEKIPFLEPLWRDMLQRLRQTDPDLFESMRTARNS